ncbi:MAG: hypothetical protein E7645_08420 [Ruminococcaceae bacterium]|nr:hypothetical protein [Oscillospiraceae bacterium]
MGFGLLLCGYFILTFMSFAIGEYTFATYIIGAVVVANAALKLKEYCPRFGMLMAAAGIYIFLGMYDTLNFLDELFLWDVMPTGQTLDFVVAEVRFFAELFFHAMLLWSVMSIAADVEENSIRKKAIRNTILIAVWGAGQLVLLIFPAVASFQNQFFTKLLLLFVMVCYILVTLMLHACFRDICPAGEELYKEPKRSRFAFINKMNDKFDEKSTKALRETIEYSQNKQKEREEKRKSKNSQRKHK